jgi:hypothetical protein
MAQAKRIVSGNTLVPKFFKPMSAEQKAVYYARQSAKYAEERVQWEEEKQQQLAMAKRQYQSPYSCAVKRQYYLHRRIWTRI